MDEELETVKGLQEETLVERSAILLRLDSNLVPWWEK